MEEYFIWKLCKHTQVHQAPWSKGDRTDYSTDRVWKLRVGWLAKAVSYIMFGLLGWGNYFTLCLRVVSLHLSSSFFPPQLPGNALHVYWPVKGAGSTLRRQSPVSCLPDALWTQGEPKMISTKLQKWTIFIFQCNCLTESCQNNTVVYVVPKFIGQRRVFL